MKPALVHASCVALGDRAVLITGKSGCGKSSLVLELMAYGAMLVSDDQVALDTRENILYASAPATISGLIEARGLGVLQAKTVSDVQIVMAIDLDQSDNTRIPPDRNVTILGCDIPLFYRPKGIHLGVSILQYLRVGPSTR